MTDEDGFSARSSSNGRDCSIAAGERAAWSPTRITLACGDQSKWTVS